ncbi:MAG: aldo/keto reductase [Eubacterium sp.]|nr:aldo/keto reductase [Eubacterium sp.]
MAGQPIPTIKLNDGNSLPLAGTGTYKMTDPLQMEQAIMTAYKNGCRLIDTASFYKNEEILGKVLRRSGIDRNELFITTKVWNTAQRMGDIRGSLERSLERLRLDHVDMYMIHWPVPNLYLRTWEELIRIRDDGLARSIGVCNFDITHLENLFAHSGVIPAVNQIECHPLWNRSELVNYCQNHGIAVQAYSPLARGGYRDREILLRIGQKYGKTASQIGLRWLVQQNISVIPKSVHPDRIAENFDLFDFTLTESEMASISLLDEQLRISHIPDDITPGDL